MGTRRRLSPYSDSLTLVLFGVVRSQALRREPFPENILAGRLFVENTPWLNTLQVAALSGMDIREILALNLRKLRAARGISQEELAHRAEIDRTYISSLERSVYAASIDVLDRIARVLNVEASPSYSQECA